MNKHEKIHWGSLNNINNIEHISVHINFKIKNQIKNEENSQKDIKNIL